MIEILLCSLIVSLFCNGLKISTGEGMLLNFVKVYLDGKFIWDGKADKIYYPILYCIKCMPSIYGTAIGLLVLPLLPQLIWQLPLIIFCSVTLNTIFFQWYD